MNEPNRRVHVTAEVARAEQALRAAEALIGLGLFGDAVSRAYYAALHFTQALLLSRGVEARSHDGVRAMLGLHFVATGELPPERAKDLSRLEQFRNEADYNRFFVFTLASAEEELEAARRFCGAARALLASGGWVTQTGEPPV